MTVGDTFVELLDESRAGDDGALRARQRWLRRRAEEEATLVGTLVDLAERGSALTVRSASGRVSHGAVVAVGRDFLALQGRGGEIRFLRSAGIVTVAPSSAERHQPASGDRPAPLDLTLVEVLSGLAPDRPRVVLVAGGEVVAGDLVAVGADVVSLRLDGGGRRLCYVAGASLEEALVEPV